MAGYVKVWTSIKSNPDFLSLSLVQRGAWYEILVAAKNQRDDGMVFYRNFTAMGMDWGCEGKTGGKILGILQEKSLLTYSKNSGGGIAIKIANYRYWQDLTVKELVEKSRKNPGKIPPLRPDQTKPNQSRAEHSINPHKDFLEFIEKNKKRIFDRLSQIAFRILGSEQELWDRTVLGTVVTWIRENPEKANASLARVHSGDWLLFIERWVWRDWKKKNAEIDAGRGMSNKEEQDHYAEKARSGLEPLPAAVSEIVNKVFEKEG